MERKMVFFASGLRMAAIGLPYFAATIILSIIFKPVFDITFISSDTSFIFGLTLLIIGVSIDGECTGRMVNAFQEKKLVTDGPYSVCANPMYVSKIFLSAPGIGLMLGSWLVLTTVIVGFILLKLFIGYEERYLEMVFGKEYLEYKKKVFIRFL